MRITLKDIAEKCNVSISTVSRVLNDEATSLSEDERMQIINTAKELGYRVKKKTEKNQKKSEIKIGCVLNRMKSKYEDPYFSGIIYGVERELIEQDRILHFTYDIRDVVQGNIGEMFPKNENIGVLCIGPIDHASLEKLSGHVKFMMSVGAEPDLNIDKVTVNFKQGSMMVVDHLVECGHWEIAFIGGRSPFDMPLEKEQRFLGFQMAMAKHNLPVNPDWIEDGRFDINGGYEAMKKILSQKSIPTAVYTASDRMAYGAYKAIQEMGLSIPDDIAVASFDDIDMSEFVNPPLTTVRVHKEELGRTAARLMIQRMEGTLPLPLLCYLPIELIVRESSGSIYNKIRHPAS